MLQTVIVNQIPVTPSKIICIGRNFVEHAQELGNDVPEDMVVFLKPNSSIGQQLRSFDLEPLHYEAELCFVYQQGQFIAVGGGLDLTKRFLQSQLKDQGLPWERAKCFDGAALFSDFVSISDADSELSLALYIDEQLTQSGDVSMMIRKPNEILAQVQEFMTLTDGDIVMTGTPKGVGPIQLGSTYRLQIISGEQLLVEKSWLAE